MNAPPSTERSWKRRVLRNVLIVVVLGVGVHLLLPQIAAFRQSAEVFRGLQGWALGVAAVMQVGSYGGSGYLLGCIAALFGAHLGLGRSVMIMTASSSLGLVWGGQFTTAGATFRWIRARGVPVEGALLTGSLPPLINIFTISVVAAFGLVYLLAVQELSPGPAIGFGVAVGLLLLSGGVVAWGLYHRAHLTTVLHTIGRAWARLRRKPYDPATGRNTAERLFRAWDLIRSGGWRGLLLGDALNVGFDILTLYFLFMAVGHSVGPGVLLAGYGLPLLLGKLTVLPGGIGLVEGSMAALYEVLGVPRPVTVVVVLSYRLLSFWLPILLGFPLVAVVERMSRTGQDENVADRA